MAFQAFYMLLAIGTCALAFYRTYAMIGRNMPNHSLIGKEKKVPCFDVFGSKTSFPPLLLLIQNFQAFHSCMLVKVVPNLSFVNSIHCTLIFLFLYRDQVVAPLSSVVDFQPTLHPHLQCLERHPINLPVIHLVFCP